MDTFTLITRYPPLEHVEPLPEPVVVLTLNADPAILGSLDPRKELRILANKMGLLHPVIVREGERGTRHARWRPGR